MKKSTGRRVVDGLFPAHLLLPRVTECKVGERANYPPVSHFPMWFFDANSCLLQNKLYFPQEAPTFQLLALTPCFDG